MFGSVLFDYELTRILPGMKKEESHALYDLPYQLPTRRLSEKWNKECERHCLRKVGVLPTYV